MDYLIEAVSAEHKKPVVDIFNYYVENSMAAYPDRAVSYDFFQHLLDTAQGYPFLVATKPDGEVIGFALLHPHKPLSTFSRVAEISYFVAPGHTGKGIGSLFLERLENEARGMQISAILASISSRNPVSLAFHAKHGFAECGRFVGIGCKNNLDFDEVWMQKKL